MKKIKRLELRTGQVLNPLQQGFVVGGHDHVWEKVNGCTCSKICSGGVVNGDTHGEYCIGVISVEVPSSSLIGQFINLCGGSSTETVSRPCSATREMAFTGWTSTGQKMHVDVNDLP